MLEKVNLNLKLSKGEYRRVLPVLQQRLYDLEKACWDQKIASILVFEGWDAAGKGSAIATLTERLDPRGFKLHPITAPRTYEQQRPWMWRFWLRTPNNGEMAIFDRSWYLRVLEDQVQKAVSKKEAGGAFRDIVEFEQMLADDGTVIVKFWLHINKKEQKKRFQALEKDPLESWRVTKEDWARHKKYNNYLKAAEEMLARTESEWGPWTIVEATSRWYGRRKIFETVIRALEAKMGSAAPAIRPYADKDEAARAASGAGRKRRVLKGAA